MLASYIKILGASVITLLVATSNSAKSTVSDEVQSCRASVEELENEVADSTATNLLQSSLQIMRASPKQSHGNDTLIFVHIPKNAGSTIEQTGTAYGIAWGGKMFMDKQDLIRMSRQTMPDGNDCSLTHVPPSLLEREPNPYEGAEVFCITRDPFDRAVSEYNWVRTQKWNFSCPPDDPTLLVKQAPGCDTIPACSAEGLNFFLQETLNAVLEGQSYMNDCHMLPQSQYIFGHDDAKTWCQHVLRIEELDAEFAQLMEASGLDVELVEEANVAAKNCANLTTDALDEESKRLIRLVYKDDFERLNYDSGRL